MQNKENKKIQSQYISDYIATHFGFDYINIEENVFSKKKIIIEDEKLKVLKFIYKKKNKKTSFPRMFFYKKSVQKFESKQFNSSIGLDILQVESAIAEATIIRTALTILEEEGYTDFKIIVNAVGNKESQKIWQKALSQYYRENKEKLKKIEEKKISKEPVNILFSKKEYLKDINKNAPTPLKFLSEKNIEHFKEFIEYLESFKIDYSVDEQMFSNKFLFLNTIFKISAKCPKTNKIENIAFGGRYDDSATKIVHKRKFPAIGLTLNFLKKTQKKIKPPKKKQNFYLLKIGTAAKLCYLEVIYIFKELKLPIKYNIENEKISDQILEAEKYQADFIIIIGEVEAKKKKVMIRKVENFSQVDIPIKDLKKYIKKNLK